MKSFFILISVVSMALFSATGVFAVELRVAGEWMTAFPVTDNLFGESALVKNSGKATGTFNAAQRIRINFDMMANDSLSGRVQLLLANGLELPQYQTWGTAGVGGGPVKQ